MADTIHDYLVGFSFDVDDSGASKIESMFKNLDTLVRNLGGVLSNAVDQVQQFFSQADSAGESADKAGAGMDKASNAAKQLSQHAPKASDGIKQIKESASGAAPATEKLAGGMDAIKKAAKALIGGAVAKKIVDGMVKGAKAIYALDESLTKTAKSLKMTEDKARSHTLVLQAMGKTYEEIKKDKKLKATYDDLMKVGEAMKLPDTKEGLTNLGEMVTSFQRLKVVGSYAMQWLYHSVLNVAYGPMQRFKETLDIVSKGLQANIPKWTAGAARLIEGILRIVTAFGKAAVDIVKFLDKIPGPLKIIIGLVTALAILLKTGPLGKIIAALGLIGLLLDDFYTYLEGGESLLGPFWDKAVTVFEDIKQGIQDTVDAIKQFLPEPDEDGKANWEGFGSRLGSWMMFGFKKILSNFGKQLKGWLLGDENAGWDELGSAIVQKIVDAITTAQQIESDIVSAIVGFINAAITPENVSALLTNAGDFVRGILNAIIAAIPTLGEGAGSIIETALSGIIGLFDTITSAQVTTAAGNLAVTLIEGIGAAIGAATSTAGSILDGITNLLTDALSPTNVDRMLGNLSGLGASVINAIAQAIQSAAGGAARLVGAVGKMLQGALNADANGKTLIGDLSGFGQSIIKAIIKAIGDVMDAGTQILTAIGEALDGIEWEQVGVDLANFATGIIDSITSSLGDASFSEKFTGIMTALGTGLGKALNGLATVGMQIAEELIKWILNPDSWVQLGKGLLTILKATVSGLGAFLEEVMFADLDKGFSTDISAVTEFANEMVRALDPAEAYDAITEHIAQVADAAVEAGRMTAEQADTFVREMTSVADAAIDGDTNWMQWYADNAEALDEQLKNVAASADAAASATADVTVESGAVNTDTLTGALSESGIEYHTTAEAVLDDVTVSEGEGNGIQEATQETIDNIMAAQEFSADVTVKASVNVLVEDSNAEAIGASIGTKMGTALTTALGGINPLGDLLGEIDKIVNQIVSKFNRLGSQGRSAFNRIASGAKSALGSLPAWIQTNVVDKINQSLSNIKSPNINMPNLPGNSEGSRIDRETVTRVGEGNKREYIIPVTKPNRAIPLLMQAASDLGLSVQSYARATAALGGSPTAKVTPSYAAGATTNNNSVSNSNVTVNAPATINVSGSEPRQTANLVAQNQQQLLLRNIKSALA